VALRSLSAGREVAGGHPAPRSTALDLHLESTRRVPSNGDPPGHGLLLHSTLRW